MRRSLLGAIGVLVLLALYVVVLGQRAFWLIATGEPVAVAIGVVVLVIPALTIWFVVREVRLARAVDAMAARLRAEDGLQVDDLPRSPGGRIDRAVAAERFAEHRARAEAAPADWRNWFHLAWAYDAAGDRTQARAALRRAARLAARD